MNAHPIIHDSVETKSRQQIVDLTDMLQQHVTRLGVRDGMMIVFCPHTTAGVTINENYDADVKHDLLQKLAALIPRDESYYQHAEGNSDSHLKTALVGNSATILIERGRMFLGQWQGVYFCEFDGPRHRSVTIKIVAWS